MGILYILESEKNGEYYIGSTADLVRRLAEHNAGKTKSLKNKRPLVIAFQKPFPTMQQARKMEARLKKLKSRKILERIICDGDIILYV